MDLDDDTDAASDAGSELTDMGPDAGPPDSFIYEDKLWPGWTSWSWGGEYDFEYADLVHSGTHSILATSEPYGALSVHSQRAFHEATGVSFWLFGGSTLVFTLQGEFSGLESDPIAIADLVETTSLQWSEVSIRFAELGDLQWTRLNLINNSEQEASFLVDDVVLHGVDFPSPDEVPDDLPDSGIESYVFDDQLWPGWSSWSWGGRYMFDFRSRVYSGSRSILANAEAFGALSLRAEMSFEEATAMSFWLWGGSTLVVSFQGDGDEFESDPFAVSDLATVESDKWVSVRVNLSSLDEQDWTRINFMNNSEQDVSFIVDDIILHGVDFPSPADIPNIPGDEAPDATGGDDGQTSADGDRETTSGCLCQCTHSASSLPSLLLFGLALAGWRRRRSPPASR